jgi:hypothetical protein
MEAVERRVIEVEVPERSVDEQRVAIEAAVPAGWKMVGETRRVIARVEIEKLPVPPRKLSAPMVQVLEILAAGGTLERHRGFSVSEEWLTLRTAKGNYVKTRSTTVKALVDAALLHYRKDDYRSGRYEITDAGRARVAPVG